MNIVLVSRTLDSLDPETLRSSSQQFELGLSRALARHARVTVVSLARVREPVGNADEPLGLIQLARGRTLLSALSRTIGENGLSNGREAVLVAFGYNPTYLAQLKIVSRLRRMPLTIYVFDTHRGATEHMPFLRKHALECFFWLGRQVLKTVDAVVVLNDAAPSELNLPKRVVVHLSAVGATSMPIERSERSLRTFKVVYAGSLEPYNGIGQLLDAMDLVSEDIRLEILGDGSMAEVVAERASRDHRIEYLGRVQHSVVVARIREADVLISLRDLGHPVSRFSFPSKLVEYMASGVPVITSDLLRSADFRRAVVVVRALEPECIADAILRARRSPSHLRGNARRARDYVATHHDWLVIARNLYEFLCTLRDDSGQE